MNSTLLCFVTEQNITNLIPALLLEVNKVVLIETAASKSWGKGLKNYLKSKSLYSPTDPLCTIDLSECDDNFIDSRKKIVAHLSKLASALISFNIGGGTKKHALLLQDIFNERQSSNDQLVYYDFSSASTFVELFKHTKEGLSSEKIYVKENWGKINLKIEENKELFFSENYRWEIDNQKNNLRNKINFDLFNDLDFRRYYNLLIQQNEANSENKQVFHDYYDKHKNKINSNIELILSPFLDNQKTHIRKNIIGSITKIDVNEIFEIKSENSPLFKTSKQLPLSKDKLIEVVGFQISLGDLIEMYLQKHFEKLLEDSKAIADIQYNVKLKKQSANIGLTSPFGPKIK